MDHVRLYNGDKVSYCGKKYAKELSGKMGVVIAHVVNSDREVVVDFGLENDFIMDEVHHLTRFQGHLKDSGELPPRNRRKQSEEIE